MKATPLSTLSGLLAFSAVLTFSGCLPLPSESSDTPFVSLSSGMSSTSGSSAPGGSGEAAAGPVPQLEDVRLPEAIVREWEAAGQREALRHRAEVAEAQVLALKAKLYDFLISGVQAMQIGESK